VKTFVQRRCYICFK